MKTQTMNHKSNSMAILAMAMTLFTASTTPAAEAPKAQPTAKEAKEKAAAPTPKPEPISLDDYVAGVSKPGISAADQAAFAKKYAGAAVTWTGYLRTVNKNLSPDGAFYQLILQSKVTEEGASPKGLFVAQLSGADEKRLLALEKNQKVTVSGTLETKNPAIPTIANAKLSES